ncbi:hypothetical protein PVAP13_6KG278000 [Panicum virgatum]|uniref:Uncharacterized protein n=1 Tax=Panicum virgatum TaxID=38727 RepID=A0A8T0RGA5_PANVG|nr:hypothetical protein PVAP13_6KG278000 [Panicum virgatum]
MQPGRSGPKADTEVRTLRGERWSTTRCTRKGPERRQQAELPRRRLKGGSDAIGAVVVRPTWPGFSPGRLAEGGKVKNDAFNKVNGARGRRRHWLAADLGFRLHPFPPQSRTTRKAAPERQHGAPDQGRRRPVPGQAAAAAARPRRQRPPKPPALDQPRGHPQRTWRRTAAATPAVTWPAQGHGNPDRGEAAQGRDNPGHGEAARPSRGKPRRGNARPRRHRPRRGGARPRRGRTRPRRGAPGTATPATAHGASGNPGRGEPEPRPPGRRASRGVEGRRPPSGAARSRPGGPGSGEEEAGSGPGGRRRRPWPKFGDREEGVEGRGGKGEVSIS